MDENIIDLAGEILQTRSTEESPMKKTDFIRCLSTTFAMSEQDAVRIIEFMTSRNLVKTRVYKKENDPYRNKLLATPELDSLVGLASVKREVRAMSNMMWMQMKRQHIGLKPSAMSRHMVFSGNPGTGKTTVGRIVGKYFKEIGILKSGHLVETDRSGLVSKYVGETEEVVNNVIDSALDGVLFIDEAYALAKPDSNDFGTEAIATLIKRMEDDRDRLVVILAGYSDEMEEFLQANPGMKSRIGRFIEFPDYSQTELCNLFVDMAAGNDYKMGRDTFTTLYGVVGHALEHKDARSFGNGRYVRNLFEKTLENHACRLCGTGFISKEQMMTLLPCDVPGNHSGV